MEIYISGAGVEARQASLMSALSQARDGDVIKLSGGDYGNLSLANLNIGNITLESQDSGNPAIFNSISVLNSTDITFSDLSVRLTPTESSYAWDAAVYIAKSASITFKDSNVGGGLAINGVDPSAASGDSTGNVKGVPTGRGISIVDSHDIQIIGNNVETCSKGIVLDNVKNVDIVNNEVHDVRTHGIAGVIIDGLVIKGNYIHDVNPWNWGHGDHADMIQFWTDPNYPNPNNNVTISDNIIYQGNGIGVLGIYLDDNSNSIGFTNVNILNNKITNDNAQAIRLENVEATVSGNYLINMNEGNYHYYPGVLALDGTALTLVDNILTRITVDDASTISESGNQTTGNGILDSSTKLEPIVSGVASSGTQSSLPPSTPSVETPASNPTDIPGSLSGEEAVETPADSMGLDAGDVSEQGRGNEGDLMGLVLVKGTGGNDSLNDRGVATYLAGLDGDDKYVVAHTDTVVAEAAGGGIDFVMSHVDFALSANIENLSLIGDARVGIGNDLNNMIKGNALDNVLYGLDGDDGIYAGAGDDRVYGGDGADYLVGDDGNDYLHGGAGDDALLGGTGDDILVGGDGNDRLTGGLGSDILTGGAGADKFIFTAGDLRGLAERDWITDFSHAERDLIAVNGIDANVHTVADDKFTFIGQNAFSGHAGELRYDIVNGQTLLYGDTDGDKQADIYLGLTSTVILTSSDFIL